jgi:molybdopterin-guanine dinucleotide biosynthesis protein A
VDKELIALGNKKLEVKMALRKIAEETAVRKKISPEEIDAYVEDAMAVYSDAPRVAQQMGPLSGIGCWAIMTVCYAWADRVDKKI